VACVQAQMTPPDYRTLQFNVNQNQMSVQANYQNGSYQDQYQFYLYLRQNQQNFIEVVFQYQSQDAENNTQLQLQFNVNCVYEYNSTGNEAYNNETDYVSRYPEMNQIPQWNSYVNETTVVDGIPVYVFSWTTHDNIFTVRIHISPQNVSTGVGPLTPNEVKMDFEIHDYPWLGTQTRLALETTVQSQYQSQNSGSDGIQNNNLYFGSDASIPPFGQFSWVPVAGNGSTNVVATTSQLNRGNQFHLWFSFLTDPQNLHADIVWDPTIGLAYNYIPGYASQFCLGTICGGAAIAVIVVIVAVVIVVIGVGAALVLRRRGSYETIPSS